MDPDFYTEDDDIFRDDFERETDDEWADNFFDEADTLSSLFDEQNIDVTLIPDHLNADQLGTALAFGEILSDDRGDYDVGEDTDKENWEEVMKLYPLQGMYHNTNARVLSKFEQYIDGITTGKMRGSWHRD